MNKAFVMFVILWPFFVQIDASYIGYASCANKVNSQEELNSTSLDMSN